jgi:hypothetical protein
MSNGQFKRECPIGAASCGGLSYQERDEPNPTNGLPRQCPFDIETRGVDRLCECCNDCYRACLEET